SCTRQKQSANIADLFPARADARTAASLVFVLWSHTARVSIFSKEGIWAGVESHFCVSPRRVGSNVGLPLRSRHQTQTAKAKSRRFRTRSAGLIPSRNLRWDFWWVQDDYDGNF